MQCSVNRSYNSLPLVHGWLRQQLDDVLCVVDYPASSTDELFKMTTLCLDTCFKSSIYSIGRLHNPPCCDFSSILTAEHCSSVRMITVLVSANWNYLKQTQMKISFNDFLDGDIIQVRWANLQFSKVKFLKDCVHQRIL